MRVVSQAAEPSFKTFEPGLVRDVPPLALWPVSRLKLSDDGVLQLRASAVHVNRGVIPLTGPSGMRWQRLELQFDTLSWESRVVGVPAGGGEVVFDAAAVAAWQSRRGPVAELIASALADASVGRLVAKPRVLAEMREIVSLFRRVSVDDHKIMFEDADELRLDAHAYRVSTAVSDRQHHLLAYQAASAAPLAKGTADQRKTHAGLVQKEQRAYAHLLGQQVGARRADWMLERHQARMDVLAQSGPALADSPTGWARAGLRRLADDLRAAGAELRRDVALTFRVLHEEPAKAARVADELAAPLKLVVGTPVTPAYLADANAALPAPRDLEIVAVTASIDRNAVTLHALPMKTGTGQAVNAISVDIDGFGRLAGRMKGIATDGDRAADLCAPLSPRDARRLIKQVVRDARAGEVVLGAGAKNALLACAAAAFLPPV